MASLTYGSVLGAGKGYTVVDTPQGPRTVVGDRATRNNNPGNIEAGNYANSYGAIGTDGRFAVFGSRLTGQRAQAGLIFGKNYANLSLREAIAKYAPSFENNSAAYAAAVAAAAGVSLDTKMKDIPADKRAAVVAGMQAVEGNTQANVYDAQGNLVGTIDATSPRTPNTAPTPYGPDSQMADMTPGAPIGHVARAPLGPPAAPSQSGLFAGMATPRGIGTPAAPAANPVDAMRGLAPTAPVSSPALSPAATAATSAAKGLGAVTQAAQAARAAQPSQSVASAPSSGSFASQDEKTNTGTIANAAPAGNFVSQDERASLAERLGLDPVTGIAPAPSISPPTSVAQAAPAPTIAAPKINVAAAVPAAPPQAVPSAVAAMSRPSLAAPSQPSLSPSDVYGGAIGTAQTSTPGTTVSRVNSFGPSYVTNKFGAVTAVAPDGTMMAALGGVPAAQPSTISGPLGQQPDQAQSQGIGGMFGPKAKSVTGTLAGAALGAYALGPLGGLLGGLVGKNLAQGKAPLSGLLGNQANNSVGTHTVNTFAGPMSFANPVGGLGFPSAPSKPAGYNPNGSSGNLSSAAKSAIDAGGGGLY
jgi:YD repeat-containing protein